jgi:hypothetical protein
MRNLGIGVLRSHAGCCCPRDFFPAIAHADGFAQAIEELLPAVVVPPPPALEKLDEMRPSPLGERVPFVRDFIEGMSGGTS